MNVPYCQHLNSGLWSVAIDHLIPGGFRFGRGQTSGGRSHHAGHELGLRSGCHGFGDGLTQREAALNQ